MHGFIDIHTHNEDATNAIQSFYDNFEKSIHLTQCSLGLHPWFLTDIDQSFSALQQFVQNDNVLAIGECGLDKACMTDWDTQIKAFERQIKLANEIQKPLVIHCVKAHNECLQMLKSANVPAIFHGFNRDTNIAQMILEAGHHISFGAALWKDNVEKVFKQIDLEKVFFETDEAIFRDIEQIYKKGAEFKKIETDALILQVEKNFQKVFKNAR